MELLAVNGLGLSENGVSVLQDISFRQRAGQKLALAGGSGAGKSTLLQSLAGLVQPSAGEVRVAGRRVRGPAETLVPGHPGVAYLPQTSALPHALRVEQVLRYANQRPETEAQALYRLCRIDHLAARRTDQLSGGEQQRVALARLLLGAPRLLLLDEPFSNLDRAHKQVLQGVIAELGARLRLTCLLVSHDPADTLSWADEILVLAAGQLVQQGPPARIYQQPVDEYTAALFGTYSLVRGRARRALARARLPPAAGQPLLVRPEELVLQPASAGPPELTGTVRAVRYLGSHDEAEVRLPGNVVRVRTAPAAIGVGATASVALRPGRGWYWPVAAP